MNREALTLGGEFVSANGGTHPSDWLQQHAWWFKDERLQGYCDHSARSHIGRIYIDISMPHVTQRLEESPRACGTFLRRCDLHNAISVMQWRANCFPTGSGSSLQIFRDHRGVTYQQRWALFHPPGPEPNPQPHCTRNGGVIHFG